METIEKKNNTQRFNQLVLGCLKEEHGINKYLFLGKIGEIYQNSLKTTTEKQ
jgi:hypothetical protein